jgi:hypothetical protein
MGATEALVLYQHDNCGCGGNPVGYNDPGADKSKDRSGGAAMTEYRKFHFVGLVQGVWFRKSTRLPSVLLTVLLTAWPLATTAQDNAQLPYSTVISYLELFKSLEHLNLVAPSMMVTSTNPGITPEAIEFRVKAPDGWQSFSPDVNDVIEFPDQPDWSNLTLISNQPRGTMQLVIGFSARPLSSTSLPYQELMGLVPQFDEALSALAKMQGQPPQKVKGLTVLLSEGSGAAVHVQSKKGRKSLKSNSIGVVIIRHDDALWQENPPVEFDEIPIGIMPLR